MRRRHRVEPRLVDVARLGVGLVARLLRAQLAPLLGERGAGHRGTVEAAVGRLDNLDGRELERALALALEERRVGLVDLDVELLVGLVGETLALAAKVARREQVVVEPWVVGCARRA